MNRIKSFSTTVPIMVPDEPEGRNRIGATVESELFGGLTISIPPGPLMDKLHDMFLNGFIHEVGFYYNPVQKVSE